jgi:hypothetical protein
MRFWCKKLDWIDQITGLETAVDHCIISLQTWNKYQNA